MDLDINKFFEKRTPGEHELMWSLREHGYIVDNVTNEPNYWTKDIDFLITPVFGEDIVTSIEVKWDRHLANTGNMFIELENPRSIGGMGWFEFCQADYLAYGDARNRIFYFIKLADLRNYVADHKLELKYRTTSDGSYGYLLPLSSVSALIAGTMKV